MNPSEKSGFQCPIPLRNEDRIQMAHGGGGSLMNELIEKIFRPAFGSTDTQKRHDSAVLSPPVGKKIAFTTDSYVVKPIFFPGGDIGTLAVNGTANDLAMSGAKPLALSCAFILEEGLPIETLEKVVASMRATAELNGVEIVTGDTKVVDSGKGDQIFVTTAGVGVVEHKLEIHPGSVKPGDAVLVSGDLGRHGVAILAVREGLAFETETLSDCAALWPAVKALLDAGIEVHCLRDLTRGGLASTLNEIARDSKNSILVDEKSIPVLGPVESACELLGLDPLYVANEGRFVAFVPQAQALAALEVLRRVEVSAGAALVGEVKACDESGIGRVILKTTLGSDRLLDLLTGEQLPRIC